MIQKQSDIDHKLAIIKNWYKQHYPICGFCGHLVREGGDLAHFIRRSYSVELQTNKLNSCLCHRHCHSCFDNSPDQAQYLPRIIEVMYIIWRLDQQYFNQIADQMPELFPVFEQFPGLEIGELDHHGELLQLTYLYSK